MLRLQIDEVDNGYTVSKVPAYQGEVITLQYIANDIHALGLLIKQLAGAEKRRQCLAKKKHK